MSKYLTNEIEPDRIDAPIALRDAARELPSRRGGRKVSVQCLYRWTTTGCRGVILRYMQVGCTRCTTRRWLTEFFEAITALSTGAIPTPAPAPNAPRSPAARQRAIEKADADLAKMGGLTRGIHDELNSGPARTRNT